TDDLMSTSRQANARLKGSWLCGEHHAAVSKIARSSRDEHAMGRPAPPPNLGLRIIATNSDGAELMFGPVVINPEAAVFDKALERRPLIPQIPERVAEWRLRQDDGVEGVAFGGDPLQDGDTLRLPAGAPGQRGPLGLRPMFPVAI